MPLPSFRLHRRYQAEISSLASRAKFAESAFLVLYKALIPAPDPVPSLRLAAKDSKRQAAILAENAHLKTQLEEYDAEFRNLKHQDSTIRQLELKTKELEQKLAGAKEESQLDLKLECLRSPGGGDQKSVGKQTKLLLCGAFLAEAFSD